MAIPGSDQLIVWGDVSHLEFFSANKGANDAGGANTLIVDALQQDYAWTRSNLNLVIYSNYMPAVSGSGSAIWATNTAGDGPSYLGLMDDGNLIIVQTPNFARHFPKQMSPSPVGIMEAR
jgi:hypothetical protein